MKRQKSCGPRLGKLVHQLPGVVTFAYDLHFRRMIARWKGIIEEIHFGGSIMPLAIIEKLDPEKPSFRPSKWPRKLKLLKIVNCQNCQKTVLSQLEKVGGHRYPPGSLEYIWDLQLSSVPFAFGTLERLGHSYHAHTIILDCRLYPPGD
jgi:hypothetical protein